MTELNIANYLFNVAPALGISFIALYFLWRQYTNQIEYQRVQDKNNLELLTDLSGVLHSFQEASTNDNIQIKEKIKEEAKKVREHIDIRIKELKRGKK